MIKMKKILVPVSGGKDSQCCLKLAIEKYGTSNVEGLFCDTQFEHPLTYKHIENIKKLYNVKIYTVTGGSVPDKVLKYNRFPVLGQRFCTDELKIRETRIFLKEYGACQVWYGMRLDESNERKNKYSKIIDTEEYFPHEIMPRKYPKYLGNMNITFLLPILNWTTNQVFEYLNGEENPLYKLGFDRVGCFPCLAGGDKQKQKAFDFDDFGKSQKEKVIWLENQTGKSIFKTNKYRNQHENNGCGICSI